MAKPGDEAIRIAKELKKAEKRYRDRRRIEMFRALSIVEASIKRNIRKNFTMRTGTLLNAPKKVIKESKNEIEGMITLEDVPYAAVLEFGTAGDKDTPSRHKLPGGVITPKRSKYLAIPTENAAGPDRVARFRPRDLHKPIFIPSRRGGLVMGIKDGGGGFIPMFILKESVYIKKRPYLRPALKENEDLIKERFDLFLSKTFKIK